MNFLPHSNGLHRVNMRKQWSLKEILKLVVILIGIFMLSGFIYQKVSNFIAGETLKPRVNYTRVNNMRMDYVYEGRGDYTVIFDGNIGANLNQWKSITDKLHTKYGDVKTFTYNRRGYGYSDGGEKITPEQQAEDLKILLRKASVDPPYILVGEEYGSLVLTNFAKLYPDTVAGVVLVNPIVEAHKGEDGYYTGHKIRRKIEDFGSHIGLTALLDKVNLDVKLPGFEDKLEGEDLEEFKVHRTKSEYTGAVYNELINVLDGESSSQSEGLLSGKPYYLIAKENQESLKILGDDTLTKIYKTNEDSNFISIKNEDYVLDGIRYVVKEANKIGKKNK